MNTDYRYLLEKGSKKHRCPSCGKRTLVRYTDTKRGEYLPEQYGRCDREVKCSYHLNPYNDGFSKMVWHQERGEDPIFHTKRYKVLQNAAPKPMPNAEPVFIPMEVFRQTLQGYEQNVFLQNLLSRIPFPFASSEVERVISLYCLGTVCNGYRAGAITFPFMDRAGRVRAVQVKQFDERNHTTGTDFLHSIIAKHHQRRKEPLPNWVQAYNRNETKVSCLFGERLLNKYPRNPIALVEAPKTAVYGTLYFGFPEQSENLLWLAVYNLSTLNFEKCKALQGRDVYLFPDLSKDGRAFQLWSGKAKELSEQMPGTCFKVSDLLESLAPVDLRHSGADIADVLIQLDWKQFRAKTGVQPEPTTPGSEKGENCEACKTSFFPESEPEPFPATQPAPPVQPLEKGEPVAGQFIKPETPKPESWEMDIADLETFFGGIVLPTQPVKLNQGSTVTDVPLFIKTHLATVTANKGKRAFLPYLNRLQELKQFFT